MNVGDYVRTKYGISKIVPDGKYVKIDEENNNRMHYVDKNGIPCEWEFGYYVWTKDIIKSSPNIIELLEPMDLLYIDISPDNCGGIVVPRIPETQNELYKIMCGIGRKEIVLKGVVTHEQLENDMYKVGE